MNKLKTIKQLKEELSKFPEDATFEAYEGECNGINIFHHICDGFIYSESDRKTEIPDIKY
jgi:hypothetical protein